MKTRVKKNLVLELDEDELKFLRNLTKNSLGESESIKDRKIRISFFVETSRALGYNIKDDGTIIRTTKDNK